MNQPATPASHAEMEAAFKALEQERGDNIQPSEALRIARRYPRTAALSGATSTYIIGYQAKFNERISAKNPLKSGLSLMMSKPAHFENLDGLMLSYELAFTQTAHEREASLIAMIPYLTTSLQDHFDRGLTRQDFTLISQVAVWSAHTISTSLIQDVIAIGKALRK